MFDQDFYPTPLSVIEYMLMGEDICGKRILEPSAGSGNIVNYLKDNGAKEVLACEKVPQLRRMLSGTCTLIADDFLSVGSSMVNGVDLVVMNPPFSDVINHIRHAYDIAPNGCRIISLCPNTAFKGWSKEQCAFIEFVNNRGSRENIGAAFKVGAERATDCEVSIVRLYKTGEGAEEFDGYFFSEDEEPRNNADGVVRYDAVRSLVNKVKCAIEKYDEVMRISDEINELCSFRMNIGDKEKRKDCAITFGAKWKSKDNDVAITRDVFKKQVQKDAWVFVFSLLNMEKYATSKLLNSINLFVEQQENTPFTMKNIYKMLDIVLQTNEQRMNDCVVEAFDLICSFCDENIENPEGWKTNSGSMINRRFIVPACTSYDNRFPTDYVDIRYGTHIDKLSDVMKALDYLTGREPSHKVSLYGLRQQKIPWGEWRQYNDYFRVRGYKKGTMHFEFIDESVWEKFNATVANIKGWRYIGTKSSKSKK